MRFHRYYVARRDASHRLRRWSVVEGTPTTIRVGGRPSGIGMRWERISHHFTRGAAERRCAKLMREAGHTQ